MIDDYQFPVVASVGTYFCVRCHQETFDCGCRNLAASAVLEQMYNDWLDAHIRRQLDAPVRPASRRD